MLRPTLASGLNNLYVKHTGQDYDTIERALDRDNFMSAEQAKEFGLVDHVWAKRDDATGILAGEGGDKA